MAKRKKCPVKACDNKIPSYHRLCKSCFVQLPRELKDKITGEKWWNHTAEAVEFLNNKEKTRAPDREPAKRWYEKENA